MVAWISKVQEGDFLGGITAMNDMLEMYPHDKHLLYLAGNWLMRENGNDQAQRIMEKALALDKNFPAALNDLAYLDARNRRVRQGLCGHGPLRRAAAEGAQSAGFLRRAAAHGGKLRGSLHALSRRA